MLNVFYNLNIDVYILMLGIYLLLYYYTYLCDSTAVSTWLAAHKTTVIAV